MMQKTQQLCDNSRFCYIAVFVFFVMLYVICCAPGALGQDSGMFQYRVYNGDITGGLGLALAHPLYHLIGFVVRAIPLGDFAYRVNLISAVSAAFAVANVFVLLKLWLKDNIASLVGVLTFGLSWTFWQHAEIAEVYTLYIAIFTAELIVLYKFCESKKAGWFYLLFFTNGLSIANHMWGIIPLGCYVIFTVVLLVKKQVKVSSVIWACGCWIIGAMPYLVLIAQEYAARGDLAGTVSSALFGRAWQGAAVGVNLSKRMVLENLIFIGYNFPSPNFVLFFVGVWVILKSDADRLFNRVIFVMTVLFFAFAFRYDVPDRYAFFIPFYCLAAIAMGFGAKIFFDKFDKKYIRTAVLLLCLLPIPVYVVVPVASEKMEFNLGTKRKIPYRNEYTYFLRPWQMGNNGLERFAKEALEAVEPGSIILADGTTVYPLWYMQTVKGIRDDVKIVSVHGDYKSPIEFPDEKSFDETLSKSSVYVISPVKGYVPGWLLDNYEFTKSGVIYRVKDKVKL